VTEKLSLLHASVSAGRKLRAAFDRRANRAADSGGWLHQAECGAQKERLEGQGAEKSKKGGHRECCEAEYCFH
jgi:hypothetical protein